MRLQSLSINGLRRIRSAEVTFAGATFLIGQNNYGKSTVLRALDMLLGQAMPSEHDFHMDAKRLRADSIQLTGTFVGVDSETANARGFKGRVVDGRFCYRRTYSISAPNKPVTECLQYQWQEDPAYASAKSVRDLVEAGIPEDAIVERLGGKAGDKLKGDWRDKLRDLLGEPDMESEPSWFENPGGIPGNVLSRLPRLVHIPALVDEADIGEAGKRTTISEVLSVLFADMLTDSEHAAQVESHLRLLQEAMSPDNETSALSGLCREINGIIQGVFPECGIRIDPSFNQLTSVLKPQYDVSLYSNTDTDVARQGSGLLRTAIFSMLRYHAQLMKKRDGSVRPLLVAFEEPELYLHPSAAGLLRETIYALGKKDQIVCTTHSPWMIDLSEDPQSLTKMVKTPDGAVGAINYEVSRELGALQEKLRSRVKMLQRFDDELSRVFFSDRVVVVEGDSEEVVYKSTLRLLDEDERAKINASTQLVKARGKASIIALVHYLNALAIRPFVIHDRDEGTDGAVVANKPIADAVADETRLAVLEECLEDCLGYKAPKSDKPYAAYKATTAWSNYGDVPERWRDVFERATRWADSPVHPAPLAPNPHDINDALSTAVGPAGTTEPIATPSVSGVPVSAGPDRKDGDPI